MFGAIAGDSRTDDEDMGEVLAGDSREPSLYDVRFLDYNQWHAVCHFRLTQDEIRAFRHSIENNYIFEMFVGRSHRRARLRSCREVASTSDLLTFSF
jgi:hypothetical protein